MIIGRDRRGMNRINMSLQQAIITLVELGWSKRRIARERQLDRATVTRQLLAKANLATNPALGARPGPPSLCAVRRQDRGRQSRPD